MKKVIGLTAALALALGAVACGDDQDQSGSIKGPFEATVHTGPSEGLSVEGELELEVDEDGRAEGSVTQSNGESVETSGQVNGRSIDLVFELGGGERLYGSGAATSDIVDTDDEFGGPLAGPEPGDLGDWGYAIGG